MDHTQNFPRLGIALDFYLGRSYGLGHCIRDGEFGDGAGFRLGTFVQLFSAPRGRVQAGGETKPAVILGEGFLLVPGRKVD